MTPAKIVFIEPAGKGGMIHYAYQLCRALASLGRHVTLITSKNYELAALPHPFEVLPVIDIWDPKPGGKISNTAWAIAGRKIRRGFRALRYYAEWLRIIRRTASLRPDAVLLGDIRFATDLFPLLLLRRKVRLLADICHNVHPFSAGGKSGGLFDRSESLRRFYRRIYHLFDFVFVHFERNRREFEESFGVPPERVGVIVHGNEEIFRELRNPAVDGPVLRRRLGIGDNEPVVLFFGTLSRYKGTDTLIAAFPAVHRDTRARLILAGFPFHDFDIDAHRDLARRAGIAEAVVWVPQYIRSDEVAAWMELASVIVFPYRDIYQSGAIHIAQTYGLPIVASRMGAMQDVIEDGVSGLLVPPENHEALAAAITRLLTDRTLAATLGAHAAADAHGRYSWESIARTIVERMGI